MDEQGADDKKCDVSMSSDTGENPNAKLLNCAQRLMIAERSLTSCLKRNRPMSSSLRTPSNRSEVEMILALARSYSNRTSAPQNWDPSLPVLHFSTPNPLPHQLSSGKLASMQLKLSRSMMKRKRMKNTADESKNRDVEEKSSIDRKDAYDPKRERIHKDIPSGQGLKNAVSMNLSDSSEDDFDEVISSKKNVASMNLSDSSEDYDDDDESNESF